MSKDLQEVKLVTWRGETGSPGGVRRARAWSGPAVLEEEQEVRMAEVEPREQEGEGEEEEVRPMG